METSSPISLHPTNLTLFLTNFYFHTHTLRTLCKFEGGVLDVNIFLSIIYMHTLYTLYTIRLVYGVIYIFIYTPFQINFLVIELVPMARNLAVVTRPFGALYTQSSL